MTDTTHGPSPAAKPSPGDALRFAFGMLTVLPVRVTRWDRAAARGGMLCAPLAGAVTGLCAAVLGIAVVLLGGGPMLAAVAAVAALAVLSRGLHLDGLADTADGLGSGRPAADALQIMKRSDIGPFGVVTLLLVLLAQVAALTAMFGSGPAAGALGALLSGVTARSALTVACRTGVRSARPDGLGAAVAGAVSSHAAVATAVLTVAGSAALGAAAGPGAALHGALAATAGLGAAELLLRRCRLRLGGVNGDVFGALAETAGTAVLVVLAVG
ncbi:adenosylcobinamide-GDP ribazoletransferase [Streptomyces meridianus]|uniref:Adenosylcobinamide-GDP ribazoletransferase n=1 Tax=Streptomyces meridianus TaxID=2938945 RepID=A0ABT0X3Y9_9ACTN|nr:adenosylcobinamide-GDP ribazoletransferase [Streptomyces meridianus]MCM2576377.1 adenosylcobinamide-GDP ribazoletransferase [Streptomyces meridianus]